MSRPKIVATIESRMTSSRLPGKVMLECCGKPMQIEGLDTCGMSTTAEHSRFDNMDEPCDDGRAG